jgi:hypothetical protein
MKIVRLDALLTGGHTNAFEELGPVNGPKIATKESKHE